MKVDDRKRVSTAANRLVERVTERITRSPGDRAALRRAVGRAPEHPQSRHAIAIVSTHVPVDADESIERAFYSVAALIAAQPRLPPEDAEPDELEADSGDEARTDDTTAEEPKSRNLGATLALAVAAPGSALKHDTIEARLHLLCRQRIDGLHRQLPRLVTQLKGVGVPVDWPRLILDLSRWGSEADYVAKEWLQDYYRTYFRLTASAQNTPKSDKSEDQ